MSFEQQLSRGRAGDRAALEALFARWRPLLRLQANQALGPDLSARVDPSDVVQEALARAFEDLGQFRGISEGEWVAWLQAIVAHQAGRLRRFHRAGRRDPGREAPLSSSGGAAGSASPAAAIIGAEEAEQLTRAIEGLPGEMREVIVGRVFHREPFEVLARRLGRSAGAARVLWTRALRRLRTALDEAR
jgi:RNA polymerase sigma-70 factor, ECF subfamily